ncbi:unnamed protein product [Clavelina lepadiformis]|uniref:Uncharacterized protein n=1 Tax=Clavelina lepadiformis TaxID=159417 RepID=A0ABP0F3E8_CLALP
MGRFTGNYSVKSASSQVKSSEIVSNEIVPGASMMGDALTCCRVARDPSGDSDVRQVAEKEVELLVIKEHPQRVRRRSSVAPSTTPIREDKVLEELCQSSNIEPEVPANEMKSKDVKKLVKRISLSGKFASIGREVVLERMQDSDSIESTSTSTLKRNR